MRSNNLIVLLVAVVLGGIAAILARNWLASHAQSAQANLGTIVVAAKPLGFGARLTAENLKEIRWDTGALPEGAFVTKQDVLKGGQRMVLAAIVRNEPILRGKITAPGQRATLSSMLDPGRRAVTVRVDDVRGVAGFIQPGDRVDVVLIRTEAGSRTNASYADIILQSAKVLAIDQIAGERTEQPTVAKAVTLEVSPEDAQKILLATNIGRLSLILRQPAESSTSPLQPVTERDLGTGRASPQPKVSTPVVNVPAPAAPIAPLTRRITIWHGTRPQVYQRPIYVTGQVDGSSLDADDGDAGRQNQ
jgi:pilus assembly protein CpaB